MKLCTSKRYTYRYYHIIIDIDIILRTGMYGGGRMILYRPATCLCVVYASVYIKRRMAINRITRLDDS